MRLLEAFKLSAIPLANRVVITPPVGQWAEFLPATTFLPATAGASAANHAAWCQHPLPWAGAGLVIAQGLNIHPASLSPMGLVDHAQMQAWRQVTDHAHGSGGRIIAQLSLGAGADQPPSQAGSTPAPLAPHELGLDEIAARIEMFAAGAALARGAGFDGVEIQGGDGLLIDQFLRSGSNLRGDDYGGSVGRRVRLLVDVIDAVTCVWNVGHIGVRLSPWASTGAANHDKADGNALETLTHTIAALDQFGLAWLHLVEPQRRRRSVLARLRAGFGGAVIATGTHTPDSAEALIASGLADCVSFADLPCGLAFKPPAFLSGAATCGAAHVHPLR